MDFGTDLPIEVDSNYPDGAKIWLVRWDQYDEDYPPGCNPRGRMDPEVGWHPEDILFEHNLITFDDTDD